MINEFQSALDKEQNNILPLTTFQVDDLMEKLKLLQYEKQLLHNMKMKTQSKFYFVKSTNPGEQFYLFVSICAWLIQKVGKNFEQPQEFDDPNEVIAKIVKILQEMDIPTDFPTNKLIQGAGPICIFIMNCLATQAIKIQKLSLNRLNLKAEEENIAEIIDNDAEIILERVEDEQNHVSDDSDDGGSLMDLNGILNNRKTTLRQNAIDFNFDDNFDETENWRLELERVLPQLKVIVRADARDWRAHLKHIETLIEDIDGATEDTQTQLGKLRSDITFAMDKIESREKHLNNDLQNLIKQYKEYSIELSNILSTTRDLESECQDIKKELNEIINENDIVKTKMEQRGQSMSDGSPIINIKKAITKLKEEMSRLNLEIGLLNHTIDQDIVKQASLYAEMENTS